MHQVVFGWEIVLQIHGLGHLGRFWRLVPSGGGGKLGERETSVCDLMGG